MAASVGLSIKERRLLRRGIKDGGIVGPKIKAVVARANQLLFGESEVRAPKRQITSFYDRQLARINAHLDRQVEEGQRTRTRVKRQQSRDKARVDRMMVDTIMSANRETRRHKDVVRHIIDFDADEQVHVPRGDGAVQVLHPEVLLVGVVPELHDVLKKSFGNMNTRKVHFLIRYRMVRKSTSEKDISFAVTSPRPVRRAELGNIREMLQSLMMKVVAKMGDNSAGAEGGVWAEQQSNTDWVFRGITQIEMTSVKSDDFDGRAYIKSPVENAKLGVLNPQNKDDNNCFMYAFTLARYHQQMDKDAKGGAKNCAARPDCARMKEYMSKVPWEEVGLEMPATPEAVRKSRLEELTNTRILFYGWQPEEADAEAEAEADEDEDGKRKMRVFAYDTASELADDAETVCYGSNMWVYTMMASHGGVMITPCIMLHWE